MSTSQASVSVIVPCRNEARFIGQFLDSLATQDYPSECMETIIVDGMSDDGTRAYLTDWAAGSGQRMVLDNPARMAASAMNIGLAHSHGEVIVRLDVHARYPSDYVRSCVDALVRTGADVVGGVVDTVPAAPGAVSRAISAAVSSAFGVGGTAFRTGSVQQPTSVDIVPFGCFSRTLISRFGAYNEHMRWDEDAELCYRVKAQGGLVLLCPGIRSTYVARATLGQLWLQYYRYGLYKPAIARQVHRVMTLRQLVPSLFVCSVVGLGALSRWSPAMRRLLGVELMAYAVADVGASLAGVLRRHDLGLLLLIVAYPVMHVAYGLGYVVGILRLVRGRA